MVELLNNLRLEDRTLLEGDLLLSVCKSVDDLSVEFKDDAEALKLLSYARFLLDRDLVLADVKDFIDEFIDDSYSSKFKRAIDLHSRNLRKSVYRALVCQRDIESNKSNWHTASFHYPDPDSGVTGGVNTPHIARINFQNSTGEEVDTGFYLRNRIFRNKKLILRIHSACALSEILWHDDCDCCQQLKDTRELIERRGDGIIIYLWQEGRGAGLANKMEALTLTKGDNGLTADEALDSVIGSRDLRKYDFVVGILKGLGVDETTSIELISDNEEKLNSLIRGGFNVSSVPAVGQANNLQAAIEIAEKALSGKYSPSVLLDSGSLKWIALESLKESKSKLFLNWFGRIQGHPAFNDLKDLRIALQPLLPDCEER